jgi:hypothetical protein
MASTDGLREDLEILAAEKEVGRHTGCRGELSSDAQKAQIGVQYGNRQTQLIEDRSPWRSGHQGRQGVWRSSKLWS